MVSISESFPSKYVKATDLKGRNVLVVMGDVKFERIGQNDADNKPVLYFQGKDKGMVLNKTNANNIAHLYGDDTDDWAGREIVLFSAMVDFQGKTVEAIRVRGPRASDKKGAQVRPAADEAGHGQPLEKPEPAAPHRSSTARDIDDEIPF